MTVRILAAVLNSLWQATIVAALVWLSLRFLPRIKVHVNAATRYVIWWAALGVILLLPLAPRILETLRAPRQPISSATATAPSSPNLRIPVIQDAPVIVTLGDRRTARWPLLVLALWAAVFLYRALQIVRSYFYLRGVKRRASLPHPPPTAARPMKLLLSTEISSPMAVGFLRPAVILPASLPAELEEAELNHVLLHGTAHITRYDDWTIWRLGCSAPALALQPIASGSCDGIEREKRNDVPTDWVVAHTGAARPYAASTGAPFRISPVAPEAKRPGLKPPRESSAVVPGRWKGLRILTRDAVSPPGFFLRIAASIILLLTLAITGSFAPRWIVFAQKPAFEVTSVKPNTGGSQRSTWGFPPRHAGFTATNVNLKTLIRLAYKVKESQVLEAPDGSIPTGTTSPANPPKPNPVLSLSG